MNIKNKNGVTLTILVITIVILSIVSGSIISISISNYNAEKIQKLYNDLGNLKDKVELFYLKHGTIPIKEEFNGSDEFKKFKNPNDNDVYYIIDLNKLDNLTLNNKISNDGDEVYIINETTHTIYYPKGIKISGEILYRLPGEFTIIQ